MEPRGSAVMKLVYFVNLIIVWFIFRKIQFVFKNLFGIERSDHEHRGSNLNKSCSKFEKSFCKKILFIFTLKNSRPAASYVQKT
jgi:hypothetical protein